MKLYQKIFTVIFMATLIVFACYNFFEKRFEIKESLIELEKPETFVELKTYTSDIEDVLVSDLVFDHKWNEMYATAYNALGKTKKTDLNM